MRRTISSFLIALFSFPLIAQAFSVQPVQTLPACCRRAGLHHCAMPGGAVHAGHTETGSQFNASRCALFPQAGTVSQGNRFSSPSTPFILSVTFLIGLIFPSDSFPGYSVAPSDFIHTRGPPSFSLNSL